MQQIVTFLWRAAIASMLLLLAAIAGLFRAVRTTRDLPEEGLVIVMTGTFYTDNWIRTHLVPLARCDRVKCVYMVATTPVPDMDGVVSVYPGERASQLMGGTLARLWAFIRTCKRVDADIAGGFHLLLNGLIARIVAVVRGTRSLYICGGGVREVEGGGYRTQNKLFVKIGYASPLIERLLIETVLDMDFVITMGSSVREFFLDLGARGNVVINPGGFDIDEFRPPAADLARDFDQVTVGRVSGVKRLDLLVSVIELFEREGIQTTACIVGDGPLLERLKEDARKRGVDGRIEFAGWQADVYPWLARSRVFVLTSESEGLSQAMIQAMLCGLPAVVSDVGDLSDLVVDGVNGGLVQELEAQKFVDKLKPLLQDAGAIDRMSRAARESAEAVSLENIGRRWSDILVDGR